jgi:hypothetical protein
MCLLCSKNLVFISQQTAFFIVTAVKILQTVFGGRISSSQGGYFHRPTQTLTDIHAFECDSNSRPQHFTWLMQFMP